MHGRTVTLSQIRDRVSTLLKPRTDLKRNGTFAFRADELPNYFLDTSLIKLDTTKGESYAA